VRKRTVLVQLRREVLRRSGVPGSS
jgi:hypothetical protein